MQTTVTVGRQAEHLALRYLERRGLTLVKANYRTRRGEIDLIMRDGPALVIVEVRYRGNTGFGGAAATVDRRKQQRIIACAGHYLQQQSVDAPVRFDVICIDKLKGALRVDWIRDAFRA
jgi:putative endonuclease